MKKETEKPYRNIKCVENDFLDPEEVSSKLLELEDKVPSPWPLHRWYTWKLKWDMGLMQRRKLEHNY